MERRQERKEREKARRGGAAIEQAEWREDRSERRMRKKVMNREVAVTGALGLLKLKMKVGGATPLK